MECCIFNIDKAPNQWIMDNRFKMHFNVEYRKKSFFFYLNYTNKNNKTVESIDWLNEWRIFGQF